MSNSSKQKYFLLFLSLLFFSVGFLVSPNDARAQFDPVDPPSLRSSTPQNLEVYSVDSTRVELTWDAVTSGWTTTGYNVYRCEGTGCDPTERIGEFIPTETQYPSFSDTGRSPGQTYGYAVTAYSCLIVVCDGPNPITESVKTSTVYATTSLLPVPNNLTSSSPSPTQIDLSWDPVEYPGLSGYRVYRCSEFQGCNPTEMIGTTDASTTTYSDTSLASGGYMYAVSSFSDQDESAKSMARSAHTRQYYSNSDFAMLVGEWLQTGQGIASDVNGDGVVNTFDIGVMMNSWGGS